MANPVIFEGVNDILGPPADDDSDVQSLPILRQRNACISCWELDEDELAEIIRTGRVFLSVHGRTHPPLYIGTDSAMRAFAADGAPPLPPQPGTELQYDLINGPTGEKLGPFSSLQVALAEMQHILDTYHKRAMEHGWPEDMDETVLFRNGKPYYAVCEVGRVERPPEDQLDENGIGPNGNDWSSGCAYACHYQKRKVSIDTRTGA